MQKGQTFICFLLSDINTGSHSSDTGFMEDPVEIKARTYAHWESAKHWGVLSLSWIGNLDESSTGMDFCFYPMSHFARWNEQKICIEFPQKSAIGNKHNFKQVALGTGPRIKHDTFLYFSWSLNIYFWPTHVFCPLDMVPAGHHWATSGHRRSY